MRQAIVTKYLAPTNHRGARVKAIAGPGPMVFNWDHSLNGDENHQNAARLYAAKYQWLDKCRMVVGALPQATRFAYSFVLVPMNGTEFVA